MTPRNSAVRIVKEVRALRKRRVAEDEGWLTKARIDEIERNLWDYWRKKRAALEQP